jgi:photosynthetic reaction center cytochrome c subunit
MNLRSKLLIPAAAAVMVLSLTQIAEPQPAQKPKLAEDVFKNIQVLKGTSVDDFMGTMGIMSAAVGFDCSECHTNAGTDKVDWAADDNPKKLIARQMVTMVTAINKQNFNSRQMVTCWSCHHGRDHPSTTPPMEAVYGPGSQEMDDVLTQMPGQLSADAIMDKYIAALGGADKLGGLKSYIASGTSIGFGGFGGGGQVHIYAKSPDQRTTLIEFKDTPGRGDEIRSYNGRFGWMKTPLAVLTEYPLTGTELDGARVDAQLAFPAQIKQALGNFKVSVPATISDLPGPDSQTGTAGKMGIGQDRLVNVLQGTSPAGTVTTFYFDKDSGLLLRMIRYGKTPIGRVPTQVDFADYRDVDGVKFPFRLIFAWLGGRDAIQLNQIQMNVPIEDKKFGDPAFIKAQ